MSNRRVFDSVIVDIRGPAHQPVLALTGERTVPGVPAENYWFRRHAAAYEWLRPLVADRRVLEVGCGEGYGTALLATRASAVVGLDYDALTVAHAARNYPNLCIVRGNLAALPIRTGAVDVLATLQVIEHVWDHAQFVDECRRALRNDGLLVITTPNRLTFSPGRDTPLNPFHTWEFTAAELVELVEDRGFVVDEVLGLHAGPRLAALDAEHGGSFVDAQLAGPPDEWSAQLARDVAGIATSDFDVRAVTDDALDLVVVARPAVSTP